MTIRGTCSNEAFNHDPHYWGDGRFHCNGDVGAPAAARTCCTSRTDAPHAPMCVTNEAIAARRRASGHQVYDPTADLGVSSDWRSCCHTQTGSEHVAACDYARKPDMVSHPAHYGGADNPYEVIKVCEAWGLDRDAYLFNAVKYIGRPTKGDYLEDLKKARFFLDRRIAQMERDA